MTVHVVVILKPRVAVGSSIISDWCHKHLFPILIWRDPLWSFNFQVQYFRISNYLIYLWEFPLFVTCPCFLACFSFRCIKKGKNYLIYLSISMREDIIPPNQIDRPTFLPREYAAVWTRLPYSCTFFVAQSFSRCVVVLSTTLSVSESQTPY